MMRQRFTSPPPEDEEGEDDYVDGYEQHRIIASPSQPRYYRPTPTTHYNHRGEEEDELPPSFHSHSHSQQYNQYETDPELGGIDPRELSYSRDDYMAHQVYHNDDDNNEKEKQEEEGEEYILNSPMLLFQGTNYGPPPSTSQPRRSKNRTARKVKLTQGNLVLDCLVPTRLLGFLPKKEEDEFKYMRYSAVTVDPEGFESGRFVLRQCERERETELMVVVTLYNENEELFCRTLHGIMKNISHLCTRTKSKTWGPTGWKKIVVCIVADGRKSLHPRILDALSAIGVYQEGMAKNYVDGKKVVAHLYEYTTQLSVDPEMRFRGLEGGIQPCQILFCLKEENKKKLNSHRWALQAFGQQLQPNVVVLIDAGTRPGPKSLYYLWKTFDLHSNVAGASGEITVMKGKWWKGLINPLVAAQNFEYKMSNILDKPTESLFGYITVLPGAFSAYRFIALQNDALGRGPLASYFKGEHLVGSDADVFTSNMYLAEDRILCWELIAKPESNWVLKYVKNATGETDVPDSISEFISQRRRWLNGSLLSSSYALLHTFNILKTDHSTTRMMVLLFEAVYNFLNMLFAWFGMGNYYIFFMVLTTSLQDPMFKLAWSESVNVIMQYIFGGTIVATFLMSLGNRPQGSRWKYMTAVISFSITTAYMYGAAAFCILNAFQQVGESLIFAQIILSLVCTYGVYVTASLLALDPWHLVTSMPQYMLFAPVYINLLNIFAFSNLHDFSWGTKSLSTAEVDLGVAAMSADGSTIELILPSAQSDIDEAYDEALHQLKTRPRLTPKAQTAGEKQAECMDYYRNVRTNVLLAWALSNGLLVATILRGDYSTTFSASGNGRTQIFMVVILVFVAIMSLIRLLGSTSYLILRLLAG